MRDEKRKAIREILQDFLAVHINDPDAILDQAMLVLAEGFDMDYDAAEKEARDIVDELWDEAYCAAQEEWQETQAYLEARQGTMMGAWV